MTGHTEKRLEDIQERELARDIEGRTEFQLREAVAEARRRLGKEYTREIMEAELDH